MATVYLLTFKSGKCYVGMTRQKLEKRIASHRYDAKAKKGFVMHDAWRKHGEPELKILANVENSMLRETEQKFIKELNTMVPNGYNLTTGGDGGWEISEETRLKQSKAGKGRLKTEEHKAKIGQAHIGNKWGLGNKRTLEGQANVTAFHTGRKRSLETRLKMSASAKGKPKSEEFKLKVAAKMREVRKNNSWSTKKIIQSSNTLKE
jgi:group I intron endonuclease